MPNSIFSRPPESRLKLSMKISPDAGDEELLLGRRLGVDCVYTWVDDEQLTTRFISDLRARVEDHGLSLYNVGNFRLGKCADIILGTDRRDAMIGEFTSFLRILADSGVGVTTFTWEQVGTSTWNAAPASTRLTPTRRVSVADLASRAFTHGRRYTIDEIRDNYSYFIERVLPTAESCGVRLSLHPNDPPVDELGGVACLIKDAESYRRAFRIGGSPLLGMEFCVGCWLEGGERFGDVVEGIREFGDAGRIFIVHFRNVSSPLPDFHETFLDNGYMDMYRVAKALVQVGYTGTVTLDHIPRMTDAGDDVGLAYGIGYLKALFERAYEECAPSP